jgi:hypothetical protein
MMPVQHTINIIKAFPAINYDQNALRSVFNYSKIDFNTVKREKKEILLWIFRVRTRENEEARRKM